MANSIFFHYNHSLFCVYEETATWTVTYKRSRAHTHTHTHTHTRQSISNEIKSDFIEICHKTAFQNLLNYRVCEM